MTATANAFRARFPEFGDAMVYTDPVVDMWLEFAGQMVNGDRWKKLTQMGVDLLCSHHLVLQRKAQLAAALGGAPGEASGIVNSKQVDKVHVGYDVASVSEEGGGDYNATTYGRRFKHLSNLMGMGAMLIGLPGRGSQNPLSSQNAWPGPDTLPGTSTFG